jgi:hypothetical protein
MEAQPDTLCCTNLLDPAHNLFWGFRYQSMHTQTPILPAYPTINAKAGVPAYREPQALSPGDDSNIWPTAKEGPSTDSDPLRCFARQRIGLPLA